MSEQPPRPVGGADGDPAVRARPSRRQVARTLLAAAVVLDVAVALIAPLATAPAAAAGVAAAPVAAVAPVRSSTTAPTPRPGAAGRFQDPARPASQTPSGVPERIVIPAIRVDAGIQDLSRDQKGVLQPPDSWTEAGWFAEGVKPGAIGPAVMAGHLDTTKRLAVFADLRLLRPGDRISVRMSTDETVRFVVTRSLVVRKALFPTDDVYGPTPDAQLRLITCSRPFDKERGVYADNLVVFASKA